MRTVSPLSTQTLQGKKAQAWLIPQLPCCLFSLSGLGSISLHLSPPPGSTGTHPLTGLRIPGARFHFVLFSQPDSQFLLQELALFRGDPMLDMAPILLIHWLVSSDTSGHVLSTLARKKRNMKHGSCFHFYLHLYTPVTKSLTVHPPQQIPILTKHRIWSNLTAVYQLLPPCE